MPSSRSAAASKSGVTSSGSTEIASTDVAGSSIEIGSSTGTDVTSSSTSTYQSGLLTTPCMIHNIRINKKTY
jgi:hypothetical protein